MAQKKAKIGRPKLPKGAAKGRIVPVRFSDSEIKAMVRASRANKLTVSEWIRRKIMDGVNVSQPYAPAGSNWGEQIKRLDCESCGKPVTLKNLAIPAPLLCEECTARQA